MKDKLEEVYDALTSVPRFKELVGDRIKAYENPPSAKQTPLFVVIAPMGPQSPGIAGSDGPLSVQFYFQINVEGLVRKDVKEVAAIVAQTMSGLNFAQLETGLDEYFPDTKRFVDVRRYRGGGFLYDTNY